VKGKPSSSYKPHANKGFVLEEMEEETVEITGTALKKTAELIQDVISGAHSFVRLGDHWRQLVSTVESVWQPVSCRLPL